MFKGLELGRISLEATIQLTTLGHWVECSPLRGLCYHGGCGLSEVMLPV